MRFHAGNVSDQKQAEEAHSDSPTELDFMQAMSVIKSRRGGAHDSRAGWDFMQANVSDQKQAEEVHSDSSSG